MARNFEKKRLILRALLNKGDRGITLIELLVIIIIAGIFITIVFGESNLGSEADYTNVLTREGYTQIQLQGYAFVGCGEDDNFGQKFKAVKNGIATNGVICSGFTKGITVRSFK